MVKYLLITLVKGYRLFFSPWVGAGCRFEPTCSRYALEALEKHGAAHGTYLAAKRILRCHPWCEGGCDPVPESKGHSKHQNKYKVFTHLSSSSSQPELQSTQSQASGSDFVKVPHE